MACGIGSVEVSAWVGVDGHCEISYRVYPAEDIIELTLGGREELAMQTNEAGLRHRVAEFTSALNAFEAAASQPDETLAAGPVLPVNPPAERIE
jgi:hypothetical protein